MASWIKNIIVGRLSPLNVCEEHTAAIVSVINLSLASYKILSKTQLQSVLKCLFTNIVPVDTDILSGVGIAYKTLLHIAIMDLPSESLRTKLTRGWYKIRKYVPVPDYLDPDLLNEIADDVHKTVIEADIEPEVDTEDADIFYGSVQYQNEKMLVDAVSYQQPTTHPLLLSISRK